MAQWMRTPLCKHDHLSSDIQHKPDVAVHICKPRSGRTGDRSAFLETASPGSVRNPVSARQRTPTHSPAGHIAHSQSRTANGFRTQSVLDC